MRHGCNGDMAEVLKLTGNLVGARYAWHHNGRFHFKLDDSDRTVAVSTESAGRLRVDACHLTEVRDTRWVFAYDRRRLARVVSEMAATPVAA